ADHPDHHVIIGVERVVLGGVMDGAVALPKLPHVAEERKLARLLLGDEGRIFVGAEDEIPLRERQKRLLRGPAMFGRSQRIEGNRLRHGGELACDVENDTRACESQKRSGAKRHVVASLISTLRNAISVLSVGSFFCKSRAPWSSKPLAARSRLQASAE